VADVYTGWVEGLRACGQKVIEFNLDDRLTFYGSAIKQTGDHEFQTYLTGDQAYEMATNGLYATLYQARPDVLLVVSGFFLPPKMLDRVKRNGTRVVVLHTESPYEDDRQLEVAAHADLNLINDPTNLERFQAVAPTMYMPHAYRPAVHSPGPSLPGLECDLAFVGTGFPSRVAFFEAMDLEGLDVLLAGTWMATPESSPLRKFIGTDVDQCLENADAVPLYRSARCGINLYRREAERPELSAGWALGPREIEMAACGLFFLRDPRGEGDEVLDMLPTFTSPAEASDLLRYWLARPDERAVLARKAHEAIADRTFDNHAGAIVRLLDS
jgi:spore maturation protein CgeB